MVRSIRIIAILLLGTTATCYAQGFRGYIWKTTLKTVLAKEPQKNKSGITTDPVTKETHIIYLMTVAGNETTRVDFRFRQARLVAGEYEFRYFRVSPYPKLLQKLIDVHGKPNKNADRSAGKSIWKKGDTIIALENFGVSASDPMSRYNTHVSVTYYDAAYYEILAKEKAIAEHAGL